MKDLKECLQAAMATPANTTGMGNPSIESGDVPIAATVQKLKRKKKRLSNRHKKA